MNFINFFFHFVRLPEPESDLFFDLPNNISIESMKSKLDGVFNAITFYAWTHKHTRPDESLVSLTIECSLYVVTCIRT